MKPQEAAIFFGLVVAAVATAGWLMNAFRDNPTVDKAIRGFDS